MRIVVLLALFALNGCVSNVPAPVTVRSVSVNVDGSAEPRKDLLEPDRVARKGYYFVRSGDTLYRIALEHGQAYRDIASWNGLDDPNKIEVGQELRVAPPESDDTKSGAITKPIGISRDIEQRSLDSNSDTVKSQPKAGREAFSEESLNRLVKSVDSTQIRPSVAAEMKPEPKSEPKADAASVAIAGKGDGEPLWAWPSSGKVAGQFQEGSNKGLEIQGKKGDPIYSAADGKVVYSGSGLRGYGQLLIVKHNNLYLTAYAHNSKILVKEGQNVSRGQKVAEMGDSEADQVKLHFEVRRQGKPVDPLKYLPPR